MDPENEEKYGNSTIPTVPKKATNEQKFEGGAGDPSPMMTDDEIHETLLNLKKLRRKKHTIEFNCNNKDAGDRSIYEYQNRIEKEYYEESDDSPDDSRDSDDSRTTSTSSDSYAESFSSFKLKLQREQLEKFGNMDNFVDVVNEGDRGDPIPMKDEDLHQQSSNKDISELFDEKFDTNTAGFWSYDGIILVGHGLSILFFLHNKGRWMLNEWNLTEEGHAVSKMLVILFLVYMYSFITWGLEFFGTLQNGLQLCFPQKYEQIKNWIQNFRMEYVIFMRVRNPRTFVVLTAPLYSMIGCSVWDAVWLHFVCKSHHDRSCMKTWIGKMLLEYRNAACYDGKASYAICEKFVSFMPLVVLTGVTVIIGNVIMPLFNDHLDDVVGRAKVVAQEAYLEMILKREASSRAKIDQVLSPVIETQEQVKVLSFGKKIGFKNAFEKSEVDGKTDADTIENPESASKKTLMKPVVKRITELRRESGVTGDAGLLVELNSTVSEHQASSDNELNSSNDSTVDSINSIQNKLEAAMNNY